SPLLKAALASLEMRDAWPETHEEDAGHVASTLAAMFALFLRSGVAEEAGVETSAEEAGAEELLSLCQAAEEEEEGEVQTPRSPAPRRRAPSPPPQQQLHPALLTSLLWTLEAWSDVWRSPVSVVLKDYLHCLPLFGGPGCMQELGGSPERLRDVMLSQ
ncbi:hypothetical protein H632_c4745p0, partial [Helicosporidium sp. ATCC 50920]